MSRFKFQQDCPIRHCIIVVLVLVIVCSIPPRINAQEQNPLTANGGSVLAMAGDGCVALAVDKRFASGNQVSLFQTLSCSMLNAHLH